jgi:hypothetical protein
MQNQSTVRVATVEPKLVGVPQFNWAGVCQGCLRLGCVSEWCVAMHAVTVWMVCQVCTGTGWAPDDSRCSCGNGVEILHQAMPEDVRARLEARGITSPYADSSPEPTYYISDPEPGQGPAVAVPVSAVPVSAVPVSVPPVLITVPLPRCLGCGHRTATAHRDCYSPATGRGIWWPCDICCGLRMDADGFECQECCGAGFIPELGKYTLAEMAGDAPPWVEQAGTTASEAGAQHEPPAPVLLSSVVTPGVPSGSGVSGGSVKDTWAMPDRPAHRTSCTCGPCSNYSVALGDIFIQMERS